MRRAYMIASWVALSLEGPLAQMRLAKSLREHSEAFSGPVERLVQLAFLYGRVYGKWEAGAIEAVDVPEEHEIDHEAAGNPDLQLQLSELTVLGNETVGDILADIRRATKAACQKQVVPRWRESVGTHSGWSRSR